MIEILDFFSYGSDEMGAEDMRSEVNDSKLFLNMTQVKAPIMNSK